MTSSLDRTISRERLHRTMTAARARTGYKFRHPKAVSARLTKPSALDSTRQKALKTKRRASPFVQR